MAKATVSRDLPCRYLVGMLPSVVHWGDMGRLLVMAAPLLVGGVAIELRRRQLTTRPWVGPPRSGRFPLEKVGPALVIVLMVVLVPQVLVPLLIIGGIVYLFARRNRERAGNAPLRAGIEARVCFETALDRASILGTGGLGGTRGVWIRLPGPKRLTVGADAFMISAPQALREFVFSGPESSVAFGQAVNPGDCIMITGQAGGRPVRLAITGNDLQGIWQALAGTGVVLGLRVVSSESSSGTC